MNVLRRPSGLSSFRFYSTQTTRPFVPPASLNHIDFRQRQREKPRPASPSFYTARPEFYDQLSSLETALRHAKNALTTCHLLPLPQFAREALPPRINAWVDKRDLGLKLRSNLTTSRYRRVVLVLNELETYRSIAEKAGIVELQEGIRGITELFERADAATMLARGKAKPVKFDEYGRSYTLGKRKTSSARVWIVPVQQPPPADQSITSQPTPAAMNTESALAAILNPNLSRKNGEPVTVSQILVNNTPLSTYFPIPADRTRVIHPLKLAGLLGAYNVFAIVRGGGTSGQSGAVAHGIAKGLAAHEPGVATILRKGKLLRRDPRMVERKKPGLAKARKRYAWVKR
ncbi:ribosomal protein S9/S16-domain-containing protein [Suillus paluster]|uniref:ribosomal protein S9/S16-domain-containing protein n=1 Tax=Suillus paluster TaxID=48578 RepID=UPI001B862EF0|nr:ribosomal protein S9/S16-domain-containing protein [Suillus paluster]KAG1729209.1 ribosomal protein S9/S16-domain-containing protein [Suillus paluster]